MSPYEQVRTNRLTLTRLTPADADAVFAVSGDPATWRHFPSGVHEDVEHSARHIAALSRSWAESGLGSWAIRVGSTPIDSLQPGQFLGNGGANRSARVWNLGYRLSPAAWGRGIATEVAVAALEAARAVEPGTPVTARVLSTNPASSAVVVRAGLTLAWEGPSTEPGKAGALRRIYADRTLPDDILNSLIELG